MLTKINVILRTDHIGKVVTLYTCLILRQFGSSFVQITGYSKVYFGTFAKFAQMQLPASPCLSVCRYISNLEPLNTFFAKFYISFTES